MDIDRVRYFCAFAETGSLVRASELLRISQPALSKALRQLETEIGCKLAEADGRGLRLTASGREFLASVQPLLNQWMDIPNRLQSANLGQNLRLGSFEVFTTYFLGTLLQHVPQSSIEVHELLPGKLEDAIMRGQVDIGITYVPIPKSGIRFTEATQIRMGVFGLKSFQKTEARKLPFVIPTQPVEGTPSKVVGLDGWPDHLYPRTIAFRVAMMESAMELCRQELAVAYLPEFVARLHNEQVKAKYELVELDCSVPVSKRSQSVFIVQRASDSEDHFVKSTAKALRSLK
jgi:DNA-binding transcriptional LysR family regulator